MIYNISLHLLDALRVITDLIELITDLIELAISLIELAIDLIEPQRNNYEFDRTRNKELQI